MALKKLPIGEQSFPLIRDQNLLYVDKTEHIHRLVMGSRYIFLSRPRRFGKSLTLSTIKALFSGERHLFEGLWIEQQWDWSAKHPVIHLPVNKLDYQHKGLEKALIDYLEKEKLPTAKQHRDILKTFYSGLKDQESQEALRFFMITGVSK